MEVILLEKVHKLGDLGDKVKVKAGYGRNFLIPQKKAVPATSDNLKKFETARAELEKAHAESFEKARSRAVSLADLSVTIARKAGTEGKLFGSVGTADIALAIGEAGIEVAKQEVHLPDGPLREIGDYDIELRLYADVDVTVKVKVVPEEQPRR